MTMIFYLRPNVNSFTGYKYALPGAQERPWYRMNISGAAVVFFVLLPALLLV